MHISFSPTVEQIVPISVLPHANAVQLRFTATISSQETYDELKRDGVMVQVWSDIPVRGRVAGDWGELSFEEESPFKDNLSLATISLLSEDSDGGSKEHILCLNCTVPLVGQTRFAYTYRLVYPSGKIRWLGQFGQNGVLLLEQDSSISLGEGWRLHDETAGTYIWHNDEKLVGFEVARLDRKDCAVWAIGKESSLDDPTADSSVVFFVPRVRPDSVALPQTFVLSASASHGAESSISVTHLGSIKFTTPGKGSLLLRTYNPGLDPRAFVDTIVAHSGISPLRILGSTTHVVLTSPKHIYPISAAIIPLSPTPSPKLEVCIFLQGLSALLPNASHICISPRFNNSFYFYAAPPSDEKIAFVVNATGGQFILVPIHCLFTESSTWHISVLTPYAPPSPVEENRLPTPPPSPKLYPVVPRETSSMLVPSLLDLNGEERAVTLSPRTSPASSATAYTIRARNGVMLCMQYFFTLTAVILKSLFAIMFPLPHRNTTNDSGVAEQTPLLSENTAERRTPDSTDHASDMYSPTCYAQPHEVGTEPNIHLSKDLQAGPRSDRNGFRTAVPVVSVHITDEYESSPADSPAESEPELRTSPAPLFMDTPGGTVSMILQALRSNASADEVGIELNGIAVDRNVEKLDEGIYSLKFSAGVNGGKMKIFAGLV